MSMRTFRNVPRAALGDDTDPLIERTVISLWRGMSAAARLARASAASAAVGALARAGARQREAARSAWHEFAAARLGSALASAAYASKSDEPDGPEAALDHLAVVRRVVDALESCGVRYVIGGSLASSLVGEPRATIDADLMIDLSPSAIPCVLKRLGGAFYADADSLARAVRERTSANIVHLATATKIDLFVMGATPIEAVQMNRRVSVAVGDPPVDLFFYTAEDILLQKLRWYRLGGEVSDRQWRDSLAIVLVQGDRLDVEYLRASARAIGVDDLVDKALRGD